MVIGITNTTSVSLQNLTEIANSSSVSEFYGKVNHIIYGDVYFYIMLWVLWVILFFAAQQKENQPLTNAMYSGVVVTFSALFLRAIEFIWFAETLSLINDFQLFSFAIITIFLISFNWMLKRQ